MKQRLVGALVLLSLGVVLWSLLFTGNPMRSVDTSSQIPEPMRIDAEPPRAPAKPAGVKQLSESWVPEPDAAEQQAESSLPRDEPAANTDPSAKEAASKSDGEADSGRPNKSRVADKAPKQAEPEAAPQAKPTPPAKQNADKASPAANKPKQAVTLDEQRILPKAWVVQVASFRSEDSADGLKKKLQLRGYKAYVEKQSLSGRPLYRVMIGPKLSQTQAESIRDEIEKEFRLKGLVMRFKR